MTVAFRYRRRHGSGPTFEAVSGVGCRLDEKSEYVLLFDAPVTAEVRTNILDLRGEMLGDNSAFLSFRNFVGQVDIAGVPIEVHSEKLGAGGTSRLLSEVSELASGLLFGWGTPTTLAAQANLAAEPPVPYHQLQYLRRAMLGRTVRKGNRLQDWLGAIERSPTRRFAQERPVVGLDRVRHLDQQALQSVFSHLDRLVPVPVGSPLAGSPLARALTFGSPARAHMPATLAAPRGRLSLDTPENRFVRHVVTECVALVQRFVRHPKLDAGFRRDCTEMGNLLEQALAAPALAEAGRLSALHTPTQALTKSEGYREVFGFWLGFGQHVSLPLDNAEAARFLEGRDVATLYEYWVFLKILEAVCEVTGRRPAGPPEIDKGDFGDSLGYGIRVDLGEDVRVAYNPTFTRSRGDAYSTPLRPDVVVTLDGERHAFDAKYRLDRMDDGNDADDGDRSTYKRADLYKMHAYRDAIRGMRTACAVYPGSEFVFFGRDGGPRRLPGAMASDADGVGAIPLRPSDVEPASSLRAFLAALLSRPTPASP
ncbi:hypothetical protein PMNALOAF_3543 [Methylobacterium adhaesivum]|uniref:DUF2357 domain-containing protein n=1 Tax=Methylobacterium adhaesivum TaxID=333297 RepID=A0ABT8BM79_9HYPH|nr:DUF2357 domain-containing protein [Methylobacterium adhaesivum]MDN3592401.1 DUF2357 domain-containing protein [Methylobacterium adhaesivum]GJD32275.1 hypothetical protein PMNALOAF_3543 [Methylobacterium adhaesivum]